MDQVYRCTLHFNLSLDLFYKAIHKHMKKFEELYNDHDNDHKHPYFLFLYYKTVQLHAKTLSWMKIPVFVCFFFFLLL